jgi:hypothetical protein
MRAATILPPPRQYSFLGGFVTNILRDFLSSDRHLVAAPDPRDHSTRSSSLCNVLIARLFHP